MSGLPSAAYWAKLELLLDQALELGPAQRSEFLDEACGNETQLRADLSQLLEDYDTHDELLDHPAVARFTALLHPVTVRPPDILGDRYRIGNEIGHGGMATVYLAHDLRHDRPVAVKVLRPELAAALGTERFLAEIKTTANLQHSHILPLHDSGESEGLLFYVMPYVDGESLRQRLEREGQLEIDDAVRIARDLTGALEHAHRHGIVHRDVKPENILLREGSALLADFGIALAATAAVSPESSQPGRFFGTPTYMSPEQAGGTAVIDTRTDIYALGTVLYEMLAGEPPFSGATATSVLSQRSTTAAPSVRLCRPAIPETLDSVVARALAREPMDRFDTAAAFGTALEDAARPTSASTPPARARTLSRLAGAALVVAAISLGVWTIARNRGSRGADTVRLTPTPIVRRPAGDPLARELYRQGVAFQDQTGPTNMAKALDYFEKAAQQDSTLAGAYGGIADINISYAIGNAGDFPPAEYFRKARDAVHRGLAVDSLSPEALTAEAKIALLYDFDWAAAEHAFTRALALKPDYRMARTYHAVLLEFTGRFDSAMVEANATLEADPLSKFASLEASRALFFGRRYDRAIDQLRRLLERDSSPFRAHLLLGQALEQTGQLDSAVAAMQRAVRLNPNSSRTHAFLSHAYALAGRKDDAMRELGVMQQRARRDYVPAFDFAVAYVGLGKIDEAFASLHRALEERSMRPYLMDATFDPIRADPRYQELLREMHLPVAVKGAGRARGG